MSCFFIKIVQDISIMETTVETPKCDYYDRDFTGCVLGVTENNGYHDSDFFAIVWDEEQGCVRTIEDGTTRAYAPSKYSRADATPEVMAKARAWWSKEIGPKQAYSVLMGHRASIDVGCEVEVIKGRNLPKGTTGQVVWKGKDAFNPRAYRIGIRLINGTRVFTAMSNVLKLNVLPPTEADIQYWIENNNPY
jgi:hypothetical protein